MNKTEKEIEDAISFLAERNIKVSWASHAAGQEEYTIGGDKIKIFTPREMEAIQKLGRIEMIDSDGDSLRVYTRRFFEEVEN